MDQTFRPWMIGVLLLCALLAGLVLASCDGEDGAEVTVGTPSIDRGAAPVPPSAQVQVSIPVSAPESVTVTYEWTVEDGEIMGGQGTSAIVYQAPAEAGIYGIHVKVMAEGTAYRRDVSVTVENVTPTSDEASSEASPEVTFTYPSATGEQVEYSSTYQGTITNMPAGQQLWIVVYSRHPDNLKFHPQDGPATIDIQGRWSNACKIGGVGQEYAGYVFDILAVLVDAQGGQEFRDYLEHAAEMSPPWDGMPSLPDGALEVERIYGIVRK